GTVRISKIFGKPLICDPLVEKATAQDTQAKKVEHPSQAQPSDNQGQAEKASTDKPADAKAEKPAGEPEAEGEKLAAGPGAKIAVNEDDWKVPPHKQKDGTIVYEYNNGDVTSYDPKDKSYVTVRPDNSVSHTYGDGTVLETDQKGNELSRTPGVAGDWKVPPHQQKDGTTVYEYKNGDETCYDPKDDSSGTVKPDNSVTYTRGDGTVVETDQKGNELSRTYRIDAEKTIIVHPDKSYDYVTPEQTRHYSGGDLQWVSKYDEKGNLVKD